MKLHDYLVVVLKVNGEEMVPLNSPVTAIDQLKEFTRCVAYKRVSDTTYKRFATRLYIKRPSNSYLSLSTEAEDILMPLTIDIKVIDRIIMGEYVIPGFVAPMTEEAAEDFRAEIFFEAM